MEAPDLEKSPNEPGLEEIAAATGIDPDGAALATGRVVRAPRRDNERWRGVVVLRRQRQRQASEAPLSCGGGGSTVAVRAGRFTVGSRAGEYGETRFSRRRDGTTVVARCSAASGRCVTSACQENLEALDREEEITSTHIEVGVDLQWLYAEAELIGDQYQPPPEISGIPHQTEPPPPTPTPTTEV